MNGEEERADATYDQGEHILLLQGFVADVGIAGLVFRRYDTIGGKE